MTIEEKASLIIRDVKAEQGNNPVQIFRNIAKNDYINIHGTGPLSADGTWGDHMSYTAKAVHELGSINGPRCCKRDAMIAFKNGIEYVNSHYDVHLEYEEQKCEYSNMNKQCIKDRCAFFKG